ncbi:solute carrier family 22 member 3 isoform X2 [Agrilus planipennis]|uniref:Solute carrier family 22 member 3 isoform X2 n=1 Tax=Agrilus planipennis TaxID=224129 RepID=A0A7F5QVF5_AGRPL|nr:solute carrier family 22 member 3 isoform X2 [Agrilus planipennis]
MGQTENSIQSFDDLMELVGKNGTFQKRFNLIFNFALVVCISMANINIVIAMSVPDHWCKVPGQNLTNYTKEEWRRVNIPISEINGRTKTIYHKCSMYGYNVSNQDSKDLKYFSNITDCRYGWEYDKTWFQETIPSSENWVCSESLKVSNTFAVMRIADVLGTFICGQLGDVIGRKPIFVVSVLLVVIGNLVFTVTSTYYPLFLVAAFTAGFTSYTAYQAPLVIGMEISREKDKAYIAMLQNVGRTVGLCILPPFMWLIGHWKPFMVMSSLPCLLFFIPYRYIIESPRWLMSKGKSTKSLKAIKTIAKINGSTIPEDAAYILRSTPATKETTYGAMSLFSSWRMAKNTTCLVICWVVSFTTYLIMTLNISNVEGNPFLNFVYQGAIELPAIVLGRHFSDRIGRKLTNVGSFIATVLGCIPILFIVKGVKYFLRFKFGMDSHNVCGFP